MAFLNESNISFLRYVQEHKRASAARAREGAAYAYGPELRTRTRLGRVRPVVLALELGLREFQKSGRARLLEGAVEATSKRFGSVAHATEEAAAKLGLEPPRTFISPTVGVHDACVFGTGEEALVVLPAAFVDHLSAQELLATVASALGRIHNQHTALLTALWVLETGAPATLQWVSRPAGLLMRAWAEGANISADRAALLVTRNMRATAAALAKRLGGGRRLLADIRSDEALQHLDSPHPIDDVGLDREAWNAWRARVKALQLFAETSFYKAGGGETSEGSAAMTLAECNERVASLLGASV